MFLQNVYITTQTLEFQKVCLKKDGPWLIVDFNKWLNLLVWPNDAGKTAIIDALKLILKTHSSEWVKLEEDDFYIGTNNLRIEVVISDKFDDNEKTAEWASNFTEWLWFDKDNKPQLKLILEAFKDSDWKVKPYDIKAGNDDHGYPLTAEAKEHLKSVYLKPLRDAENELAPKKWSRLSQILLWTKQFKNRIHDHTFNDEFEVFSQKITEYFSTWEWKSWISDEINSFLKSFGKDETPITPTDTIDLKYILGLLTLAFSDLKPWLWSQNLLFIATELLHLATCKNDMLKVWLIEEIEAHLHPQNQLKVIDALQKQVDDKWFQLIITTHSPNISSKVKLENIIICDGNDALDLRKWKTHLDEKNYIHLERFLDVTKANLFFSNGLIFVEWWSEEILLPAIAKTIGYDLTDKKVSIINVGNTWFGHYQKIFLRNDNKNSDIKVSIVTDIDIDPDDKDNFPQTARKVSEKENGLSSWNIKWYVAKEWTLERCLWKWLGEDFKNHVLEIHSQIMKDGEDFEESLKKKLQTKTQWWTKNFSKVESAYLLAEKIESWAIALNSSNDYLKYLFDAIKHACGETI